MNIIIVGNGKVGYTLAEYLSRQNHDVTIVDKDKNALTRATETLDVLCVRGNGGNVRSLIEAGAEKADVIIAVTANDELNMVCCLAAKQLGTRYSIARIRDPEYTESLTLLQEKLDIDQVINPERAAAQEISRLLRFPFAMNIESFAHGRVEMVEFLVTDQDDITGEPLSRLHARFPHVQFVAVQRHGEAVIPDGSFVIRMDDRLYVSGEHVAVTRFFKRMAKDTQPIRSAMLIGGGHISYYLAKQLVLLGLRIKLVEINREKCRHLSETLEDVIMICGDGTDREVLTDENMEENDALICLTDRDEENIVTGLYGVRMGVRKVVVKVNRLNTPEVLDELGLDNIVSPKISTANAILRSVRALSHSSSSRIQKVYGMLGGKAEAYEFTALAGSGFLNVPLARLKIKKGVLVCVLVRGRRVIIPFGGDHIEAGDTVILAGKAGSIEDLDDAFTGVAEST